MWFLFRSNGVDVDVGDRPDRLASFFERLFPGHADVPEQMRIGRGRGVPCAGRAAPIEGATGASFGRGRGPSFSDEVANSSEPAA